jgi:signal transduction histidine kinase
MALLASLAALGLALLLDAWLHQGVFVLFLGAVSLSARYGGLGSGLLATAFGVLACTAWLTEPGRGPADLAVFGLVCLLSTLLHAHLRERWRREAAARHRAEEAIRLRDRFLAAAAHDLRNPLSVIVATSQFLRKRAHDAAAPDAERWSAAVGRIETAARRVDAQLDQLHDLAATHAGRPLGLRRVPTDLVVVARGVLAEWTGTTTRHHLRLETEAEHLIGSFDLVRLERVIDNLVGNAIKYSPRGGAVTLALRCQPTANGTWAVLSVRDEGLGIPAADLPRIFDQFHRAQNVGRIGGTGLGLAVTHEIIAQHGGGVTVETREGYGSTFTVRLPLQSHGNPCRTERG